MLLPSGRSTPEPQRHASAEPLSIVVAFTVDGAISTPTGTSAALSDVAPQEFWSPYTLQ